MENDQQYRYYSIEDIPEGDDKQLSCAIQEINRLIAEGEK